MTTTTTTLSNSPIISRVGVREVGDIVGDVSPACECIHCAPHRKATGCHCDHPATWMVSVRHMHGDGDDGCGVVVALCDPCCEAAKAWALQVASGLGELNDGRCFNCRAAVRCADDILTVVSLR